ncbi:RipA family octameric membrane protein [Cyclobacterium marinum]|uniref:RipA family octameric membrane protein n=1 Tax=Cyclobacterium marinum TaxID=104 RepID=UPI0011EE5C06|nr:hypothetical protein [Cyclobacterium marinum]MBI0400395.1 hypothetical protein [Cyclobacterium marinum]
MNVVIQLKTMKKFCKSILEFFYKKEEAVLKELTEADYVNKFITNADDVKIKKAYEMAWEAKNFEIENYWKRANYFWAFQVASFAGYFSFLGSISYSNHPQALFAIISIGILTAFAWALINKGSKTWQRHWEIHVDMLEEKVTGPLYKVVTTDRTFSVSKINEIVSRFFILIWIVLGLKYFIDNISFIKTETNEIDYLVIICSLSTLSFIQAMFTGYGRGRFGKRKVRLYERDYEVR